MITLLRIGHCSEVIQTSVSSRMGDSSRTRCRLLKCLFLYGEFKEEMLRDRLVVGITDAAMSQKLQMDVEVTLKKVKKAIYQKEAVCERMHGDG